MQKVFISMATAFAIFIAMAPHAFANEALQAAEREAEIARGLFEAATQDLAGARNAANPNQDLIRTLEARRTSAENAWTERVRFRDQITRELASERIANENGRANRTGGGGGASEREGSPVGSQNSDQYSFGRNSMGRAGGRVAEATRSCGTQAGQAGCERVAKSLETMSNISDYADYAGYAAVAGTVLPVMIASPDQKKDQLMAAQVQEVAGYVNLAAGVTDIGIGARARMSSASELERIRNQERVNCAPFELSARGTALRRPPGEVDESEACQRFRSGQAISGAVEEVKSASNTHFLMGGLKAVGGVAALYLAKQSRQNAKDLETLEAERKKQAEQPPPGTNTVSTVPSNAGINNNTVGFAAPDITPPSTTPAGGAYSAPRTGSSGGSAAPIPGNNASLGLARRSAGGGGGSGSAGGAAGGLGSSGGASTAPGLGEDPEAVAEDRPSDWAGGGGSLNQGGMSLGSGDGGFGNLLGSMSGMLGGGDSGAGNNMGLSFGDRGPASADGQNPQGHAIEDTSTTLFQRVSGAITRQVRAGQIVNSTADANKI